MYRICSALVGVILFGGVASAGQESAILRIKEPEVKLPEGVSLGQYRRVIQPFENWTLICDENLKAKKRVCNITQAIVDQKNRLVFSWSVAATEDGKPFMILRTLPDLGANGVVTLGIPDGKDPAKVSVDGCNTTVCVGMVPIGPRLRPQIAAGAAIKISYATPGGEAIEVAAPLKGVEEALAAID